MASHSSQEIAILDVAKKRLAMANEFKPFWLGFATKMFGEQVKTIDGS
jgi:hypothetical protein